MLRHDDAQAPAPARSTTLLKQASEAGDGQAALALLERSMALGHRRIALIRYLDAQSLRAPLEARHHDYVRAIAARMSPAALARVAGEARARAGRRESHDNRDDHTNRARGAPAC
jgi:hypothetical protein